MNAYITLLIILSVIGFVVFLFASLIVLSLMANTPDADVIAPIMPPPQQSSGLNIMDDIACSANIGCAWGGNNSRAFCLPGYSGPTCSPIST